MTSVSATTTASTTGGQSGGQSGGALNSLSSDFSSFLKLLMTQLKNQDPTAPMDANQFTSELVQFSSVEQQINTNTSLTQLIELTQAANVTQSSAILGKQVTVRADQIPLQDGTGQLTFTAPAAENVSIDIQDSAGRTVRQSTVKAAAGSNTWQWDGKTTTGDRLPDGAYTVAVTGGPAGATATAVPFTVSGKATALTTQGKGVNLQIGALSVPFSAVRSVGN